jgi:ssDNA-binding Zn-finger/Zn-ribbon topoisomerase 1
VVTPCPKCGAAFLTQRGARGKRWLQCWREGCDYRRETESA